MSISSDRKAPSTASLILKGILFAASLQYGKDVYDVYQIVSTLNQADAAEPVDRELEAQLIKAYEQPKLIDKDEFRRVCSELENWLPDDETKCCGLFDGMNDPALRVFRELATAATGRRAVALQIAHPYIAKGVMMHSNVLTNTYDRAEKTRRFTFNMLFGTKKDVMSASNQVRHLHNKVKGDIGEDVGIFSKQSPFDANQRDAVIWVAATMPESTVVAYELLVRPCTNEEKEAVIQVNRRFMMCFGVDAPYTTWAEYERYNNTMLRSEKLLKMSEACYDLVAGLSATEGAIAKYINRYFKWMTYITLPQRLTIQFYGRKMTRWDYIMYALAMGRVRFIYRLLPNWLRHVGPYHFMARRAGVREHWSITDRLVDAMQRLVDRLLKRAFKERSKEEVELILKEARNKRFGAENAKGLV